MQFALPLAEKIMVGEGGGHAEEPDEEQLRTLWCGGINEKVTEEVNKMCVIPFSDSCTLAGPFDHGLVIKIVPVFFSFRFYMNCS